MAEKKKKPTVFISQDDQYLFAQGTHYDIYEKLGAHPSCEDGEEGMFFAVWAPNAKQVYVIGEFNDWNESASWDREEFILYLLKESERGYCTSI